MARYNFFKRETNGDYTSVTVDKIVDKVRGYSNDLSVALTGVTNLVLTGVTEALANSTDRKLYIDYVVVSNTSATINIYSDVAKTDPVAAGSVNANGTMTITAYGDRGVSGSCTISGIDVSKNISSIFYYADGTDYAPYYTISLATNAASINGKVGLASGNYAEARASKALEFYGSGLVRITGTFVSVTGDKYYNLKFKGTGSYTLMTFNGGSISTIKGYNCEFDTVTILLGSNTGHTHNYYFCTFVGNSINSSYESNLGTMANCTFINNTSTGDSYGTLITLSNSIVKNCPNFNFRGANFSSYNCMNGSFKVSNVTKTLADYPAYTNCISSDPLFNNESINDFTLQAASPCLLTGLKNGNKKLNIGAKNKAFSLSAQTLFNNALIKKGCTLNGSNNIILSQFNKQVAAVTNSSEISLDSSASSNDDEYNNLIIRGLDGTGVGQERIITDYNGTTKVATINSPLTTALNTFYAISMNLRSGVIDLGFTALSEVVNLLATFASNSDYGGNKRYNFQMKFANSVQALETAPWITNFWNYLIQYDAANEAGVADDNFTSGVQTQYRYCQIDLIARIIA